MPSSHSQVMAFSCGVAILTHFRRRSLRRRQPGAALSQPMELLEIAFFVALTAAVGGARVYLGYHSMGQVAAGLALGAVHSCVWVAAAAAAEKVGLLRWLQALLPWLHLKSSWSQSHVYHVAARSSKID